MRLYVTITGWYDTPDENVEGLYGTADPIECARIDQESIAAEPDMLIEMLGNYELNIEIRAQP